MRALEALAVRPGQEGTQMKAIIMAGGQGTRLRPLTSDQPKPMIPIVNAPCMEHIVRLLEDGRAATPPGRRAPAHHKRRCPYRRRPGHSGRVPRVQRL